jgi:hypothetical protein
MGLDLRLSRGISIVLGAAVAAASLADPALADHGRRYKGVGGSHDGGPRVVQRVYASPGRGYAYVSSGSYGAPVLAGLIGGLVIGSVIAQAAAPPPPAYCPPAVPDDYYYDPYCHERFWSLDAYEAHLDRHDHPAWVQVIDGGSGRCVGERYWHDGRWRERGERDGGDDDDRDGGWNH